MLPGPVTVISCSLCGGLILQSSLASGNTFGAKLWTDGDFRASVQPATPSLIRCGHCNQVSWRSDCAKVDSYERYLGFLAFSEDEEATLRRDTAKTKQERYEGLPFEQEPHTAEIVAFASTQALSRDQKLCARVRAWRRWNDLRRDDDSYRPLTAHERENLHHIINLIESPEGAGQALLLTEAYRELGEFGKALNTLKRAKISREYQYPHLFILQLIEHGDPQVCLITDGEEKHWRMLRRLKSRTDPEPKLPTFDKTGPPIFEIRSRKWWFKPLGAFTNHWALIENNFNGKSSIYFFEDRGSIKNEHAKLNPSQLEGRCAVFDSLSFQHPDMAAFQLGFNGFKELQKYPGPWDASAPFGTFYDGRELGDRVYSTGKAWRSA